mgnify:CR=1 FL=1
MNLDWWWILQNEINKDFNCVTPWTSGAFPVFSRLLQDYRDNMSGEMLEYKEETILFTEFMTLLIDEDAFVLCVCWGASPQPANTPANANTIKECFITRLTPFYFYRFV